MATCKERDCLTHKEKSKLSMAAHACVCVLDDLYQTLLNFMCAYLYMHVIWHQQSMECGKRLSYFNDKFSESPGSNLLYCEYKIQVKTYEVNMMLCQNLAPSGGYWSTYM